MLQRGQGPTCKPLYGNGLRRRVEPLWRGDADGSHALGAAEGHPWHQHHAGRCGAKPRLRAQLAEHSLLYRLFPVPAVSVGLWPDRTWRSASHLLLVQLERRLHLRRQLMHLLSGCYQAGVKLCVCGFGCGWRKCPPCYAACSGAPSCVGRHVVAVGGRTHCLSLCSTFSQPAKSRVPLRLRHDELSAPSFLGSWGAGTLGNTLLQAQPCAKLPYSLLGIPPGRARESAHPCGCAIPPFLLHSGPPG